MKTVLYVSVTANGYVAQADQTHRVPPVILANYIQLDDVGELCRLRMPAPAPLLAAGRPDGWPRRGTPDCLRSSAGPPRRSRSSSDHRPLRRIVTAGRPTPR
jgi:hypothetical protein